MGAVKNTISAKEYQEMIKPGKQNKFRNVPKEYNGRTYHSTLEANYAAELDLKLKAGIIKEWKPQHRFYLKINGQKWCIYAIDFRVINADGTISYVEIKGKPTPDWTLKFEATKILFDELTEGEHAILYLNSEIVCESPMF
jgi:hypothetical protein